MTDTTLPPGRARAIRAVVEAKRSRDLRDGEASILDRALSELTIGFPGAARRLLVSLAPDDYRYDHAGPVARALRAIGPYGRCRPCGLVFALEGLTLRAPAPWYWTGRNGVTYRRTNRPCPLCGLELQQTAPALMGEPAIRAYHEARRARP